MRQHPPEAAQRCGRHLRAQPRHIPLQERARERPHPACPGRGRPGQIRPRKPAAHPQPILLRRPYLGKRKAAHVHEENAPCQRFGNPIDQAPGRATEQEKDILCGCGRRRSGIAPRRAPPSLRIRAARVRASRVAGTSRSQTVDGPWHTAATYFVQCRLPDLPRPQQDHSRRFGKPLNRRFQRFELGKRLLHIVP